MAWNGKIGQGDPGELRERAERFQSIFENSTLGIFQSSLDGRFLMVNPAFARILGYSDPEISKSRLGYRDTNLISAWTQADIPPQSRERGRIEVRKRVSR